MANIITSHKDWDRFINLMFIYLQIIAIFFYETVMIVNNSQIVLGILGIWVYMGIRVYILSERERKITRFHIISHFVYIFKMHSTMY